MKTSNEYIEVKFQLFKSIVPGYEDSIMVFPLGYDSSYMSVGTKWEKSEITLKKLLEKHPDYLIQRLGTVHSLS